jgi:glutathione S-transferase
MRIIIGTRAWSSWSMRPWLALRHSGLAFEETLIQLRWEGTTSAIAAFSPSAKVPALIDGDLVVWDSLAICEYVAEKSPVPLWPSSPAARAEARAAAAEMHSGFAALRNQCPMDIALRTTAAPDEALDKDLARLSALFGTLRRKHGAAGPWLCGTWSIADAFYAPVATRIRSYGLDLKAHGDDGTAMAYVETLLADPHFLEWEKAAVEEG